MTNRLFIHQTLIKLKMKTQQNLPEIDILFVSPTHELAENCYNCLKSGKLTDEFRIIPRYYVLSKGEQRPEIREDMLVVLHVDSKEDMEKMKSEWNNFQKCKFRAFCSEKEDSRNWLSVLNDSGIKAFIGKKEDNVIALRDYIRSTGLVRESKEGTAATSQVKEGVKHH